MGVRARHVVAGSRGARPGSNDLEDSYLKMSFFKGAPSSASSGGPTRAELDLLVVEGNQRLGFEFKRTDTPGAATPSMHAAVQDLGLDRLDVVHPGPHTYGMKGGFRALSLRRLLSDLKPL
jgi:hypothetical protein